MAKQPEPKAPAWTAPTVESSPAGVGRLWWYGVRPGRLTRQPYCPWPQSIQVGPVEFTLYSGFAPRPSGDPAESEMPRHIPTTPSSPGTGVVLPGIVAPLTDAQVEEIEEGLELTALHEHEGALHQVDYRPLLFAEALQRMITAKEAKAEAPKPRLRQEAKYISAYWSRTREELLAILESSMLATQLSPRRPNDISIGGCIYLVPCRDEVQRLDPEAARRWRPPGTDFFDFATYPAPLRPFSAADKENLAKFCKRVADRDRRNFSVEEEVREVAERMGVDVTSFGDRLHDPFTFAFEV